MTNRRRFLLGALPRTVQAVRHEVARRPPIVVVDASRCFAFRGPDCGACIGWCPEEASGALRLQAGRPVVDADRCTGCLNCVSSCPVTPSALAPAVHSSLRTGN